MALRVTDGTKTRLAMDSGQMCAMPDCRQLLLSDGEDARPTLLGDAAHIAGEKPTSARYDPNMTDEERRDYDNLIYVCKICHAKIDDAAVCLEKYPTALLTKIKLEHRQNVRDAVIEHMSAIGFPELEEATKWVNEYYDGRLDGSGFTITPPDAKMRKNELGPTSRAIIDGSLGVTRQVGDWVEVVAQEDPEFPDRLRSGFLEEYYKLHRMSYRGDDLFASMCQFAQRGFRDAIVRSAAHTVLVYLFEKCDIFEQ